MKSHHGDTATSSSHVLRRAAMLTVLALFSSASAAAPVDAKKGELKNLRGRIESLRKNLDKSEESKAAVAEQLRAVESAISDTSRKLRQLSAERHEVEDQLADLEQQSKRLERQTSAQQTQLAQLLGHQFAGGEADALKLLLSGRDPNQAARDRYFLTQLSHAQADLIQELRVAAREKQRLADAARERRTHLAEIEQRQQETQAQLLERKQQRAIALARIADRIRSQRQEIDSLRRNEQRLTQVIDRLAQAAKTRRKKPQDTPKVGAGKTPNGHSPERPSAAQNHDPGAVGGTFGALRGRLRLPVAGTIASRFGSARGEGGLTWKGLFIRTAEGAEVHAIAAGTVVFADWLRGFGNLLIVDHGDDFLSIYGNNESLLSAVGRTVKSGEAIATAGNSGGNPESGLYFELRYRGRPFDPMKWTGSR
ncbi:MAG: peptidoglycan DD-metalloendopeptidase family protein [Rhodocyclales bacterium]|nr:peptidoglycan DD-metalloendopeptidase family protein [Rhodocyclales bacterium]